jgi:hypothetical protein
MGNVYVVEHAYDRLKERNNWSRSTTDRLVRRIYFKGTKGCDVKGCLKDWIDGKRTETGGDGIFIVYGNMLYVFKERLGDYFLITAFRIPVPSNLVRLKKGIKTKFPANDTACKREVRYKNRMGA